AVRRPALQRRAWLGTVPRAAKPRHDAVEGDGGTARALPLIARRRTSAGPARARDANLRGNSQRAHLPAQPLRSRKTQPRRDRPTEARDERHALPDRRSPEQHAEVRRARVMALSNPKIALDLHCPT